MRSRRTARRAQCRVPRLYPCPRSRPHRLLHVTRNVPNFRFGRGLFGIPARLFPCGGDRELVALIQAWIPGGRQISCRAHNRDDDGVAVEFGAVPERE